MSVCMKNNTKPEKAVFCELSLKCLGLMEFGACGVGRFGFFGV